MGYEGVHLCNCIEDILEDLGVITIAQWKELRIEFLMEQYEE